MIKKDLEQSFFRQRLYGQSPFWDPEMVKRMRDIRFRAALNLELQQSGLTLDELKSRRRTENVVSARKRLLKRLRSIKQPTGEHLFTLVSLGELLGRDHTSVMHALDTVDIETYKKQVASRQKWGW